MEAAALQKGLENLGLQFLFGDVGCLVGTRLHRKLKADEKEALKGLDEFLGNVRRGLDLAEKRRTGNSGSLGSLKATLSAERAYRVFRPLLPRDPSRAKMLLTELEGVAQKIRTNKPSADIDRQRLHAFCRNVLDHLARERFEIHTARGNLLP